jgi:tRNA pseudouridine55 synthase
MKILPGTGRGTMRSMVEGGVLFHYGSVCGAPPPPASLVPLLASGEDLE